MKGDLVQVTGYIVLTKEGEAPTHRVCDINSFPMLIFKTLGEAKEYVRGGFEQIRKVKVNINKTRLEPINCYNREDRK